MNKHNVQNGVLLCNAFNGRTKNIGDFIQGIAAAQYMKAWSFIDREHLDEYRGEDVRLIMNGWFMHYPDHFPPSEKIHPLFVSFHINPKAAKCMLSEEAVTYLKHHEPIGCRDKATMLLLSERGISAFFTGCLTLTLGRTYKRTEPNTGEVLFVDVPLLRRRALGLLIEPKFLWFGIRHFRLVWQTSKKMVAGGVLSAGNSKKCVANLFKSIWFCFVYSKAFGFDVLSRAKFLSHIVKTEDFGNDPQRMHEYADLLLRRYANAEMVVTSRIHCALPSLGMGTPTCFIDYAEVDSDDVFKGGRMNGLKELFNCVRLLRDDMKICFEIVSRDGRIHLKEKFKQGVFWKELAANLSGQVVRFLNEEEL